MPVLAAQDGGRLPQRDDRAALPRLARLIDRPYVISLVHSRRRDGEPASAGRVDQRQGVLEQEDNLPRAAMPIARLDSHCMIASVPLRGRMSSGNLAPPLAAV